MYHIRIARITSLAKHINRITNNEDEVKKKYNQNVSAEDEWSHITGVGSKIEAADPMNVSDRTIFFSNKTKPVTKQEIVQEKTEEMKDQMSNTNQYMKFVNVLLKQKTENIKKILEQEKRFAEELNCFQDTPKSRHELENLNSKYVGEKDIRTVLSNLEVEYGKIKEKFEYQQSLIEKTKNQLLAKMQQIEAVREELKYVEQKQTAKQVDDPLLTIKMELKKMGINDESGKISKALQMLANKSDDNTQS